MKRILITGATGFIGGYVINELIRSGHTVIASSKNELQAQRSDWYSRVSYIPFGLEDFDQSINYYEYFLKPDSIVHLAWEGLPNYKSLFHFETNLPRHFGFLKNIVASGCKDVTVTGTCFEYGMKSGELSEDICSEPSNAYALAKNTLYRFLAEMQKIDKFELKWVRLFYMYGKGQNPSALIPQLEAALSRGDKVFNMSGGQQVRDYLPVELVAKYLVRIALQAKVTGIINCCSGIPVKVEDFVQDYLLLTRQKIELNLGHYAYTDFEPMAFWGNNKKLQIILNEK